MPYKVRKTSKERFVVAELSLLLLPFAVFFIPWTHRMAEDALDLHALAHFTLETSLNLLWFSLAAGTLFSWTAADRNDRLSHRSGLVSLVFVLSLLFPVISATDDLAQLALINDARTSQSITDSFNDHKHPTNFPGVLDSPALPSVQSNFSVHLLSHSVFAPDFIASVAAPGNTTGNHSPPLG